MKLVRALALFGSALLLSGFGFDVVQLDPAQRQKIVSIGVAPQFVPAALVQVNSLARDHSLIGLMLNASAGNVDLEAVLSTTGYDYRRAISSGVIQAANAAGFIADQLPGTRGKTNGDGFLRVVPKDAAVDAVLDVNVISVGFFATNPTANYRAGCHLVVRLVDPQTNTVLFQKQIIHGSVAPASGRAVILRTPVAPLFKDSDALNADYRATSAALKMSIDAVLAELGRQLSAPAAAPEPPPLPGSEQ